MQAAQKTFISSTFWTERIGPTAALATLKVMEETSAPQRVHEIGIQVQQRWVELGTAHGLVVTPGGLPALANFSIDNYDPLAVKTFITQAMLDHGYLASNSMYTSIAHTPEVLDQYFEALGTVFAQITRSSDPNLGELLPRGSAQAGFKRLT
jgi:glutamate-1-semialdehyde aminotransferase